MSWNVMLRSHGGLCCGMSHIFNLGNDPSCKLPANPVRNDEQWESFLKSWPFHNSVFNDDAPEETAEERFKRLIDVATKGKLAKDADQHGSYGYWNKPATERFQFSGWNGRSTGILECVLIDSQLNGGWNKVLEELGFKEVNSHRNSNTSRIIHVFHLNTGA